MNRSYKEFMAQQKNHEFVHDLSHLAGIEENDITQIRYRSGCVVFQGQLPEDAVNRLKEAYKKRHADCFEPDIEDLNAFIKKHAVVDLTDNMTIKVFIHTKSRTDRNIIFVHGWRGDANSFGNMPEMLSDKTGCKSLVYQYPTGIWEKSPEIHYISKNLDNWIRNYAGKSKLAIICHSMGGIVTRNMLVTEGWRDQKLSDQVKQLTLVASPHGGVPFAKLAKYVPTLKKTQIKDLRTDSSFLVNLNTQWSGWRQHAASKDCDVRSIFGTADAVVDPNLALGDDPSAVPILNAGHIDIVKPESDEDEIVVTINRFISESSFMQG